MAKTSIIKETRDILQQAGKEAKEHWKEPPEGQIPINDSGWYTSPNLQTGEAVDPRDCAHYPDSPYCGGNPWTRTPVGFDFDYGVDKCGVWVEATPILGFTKLPPVSVGYRQPGECREEKKPPPLPPPPPEAGDTGRPVELLDFPKDIDPNAQVFVVIVRSYLYWYSYGTDPNTGYSSLTIYTDKSVVESHDYPGKNIRPSYYSSAMSGRVKAEATAKSFYSGLQKTRQNKDDQEISYSDSGQSTGTNWIAFDQPKAFEDGTFWGLRRLSDTLWYSPISEPNTTNFTLSPFRVYLSLPDYYAPGNFMILGTYREIVSRWQGFGFDYSFQLENSIYIRKAEYKIGYISIPDSRNFPPPPDQKKKKDCCMQCCNSGSQQANKQNQDLEEIKKMLRELKKRIGTDEYPVKMPASLNTDYNDSGQKSNPGTVTEENLTSVLGRFIRYFDGVMGEWGIGFKVADADPTKEGDQPKFIHAPNLAELSAEMYSHIFDMWIMQYQLLHLHQRHAIESMLGRKVGIQNYYLLEALVDWCGFKRKDITKKIPFLFDIDSEKFDDFLKNKEQEIQILDFDPDDENSESFPDQMLRLKRMAAIIEATHTKRFNPNEDISKSVMGILQTLSKNTDRVNKDEVKKEGSEPDFDQWLREAETAFVNKTGQGDPNSPYGVPYAQRPRLTKLQEEPEQPTE